MSADDLNLKYELDANDLLRTMGLIDKAMIDNATKTKATATSFKGLAQDGDAVSRTVTQLIEGVGTLTTAYKIQNGEISITSQKLTETLAATKALEKATKDAARAEEDAKQKKLEARRVNETFVKINKEIRDGLISGLKVTNDYNAKTKELTRTYEGLDQAGRKVVYTTKQIGNEATQATQRYVDASARMREAGRLEVAQQRNKFLTQQQDIAGMQASNVIKARLQKQSEKDASIYKRNKQALDNQTKSANTQRGVVNKLAVSWQSMARLIAVQLAHRAISGLVRDIREGVTEAVELQKRIGEIQTIAQDRPIGFDAWAEGIRAVSDAFGFEILDAAEASYQTLSNQVAKGAEAFDFMREAAEFAIVTNSSLTDSVDVISSALNSYRLSSIYAEQTAASLFKTIELGRVRSSEIANTLGRVTVVGGQLGISLDEINTSLAQVSIKGLNARQSLTQVLGIMNGLLKPTEAMKDFFKSLGVASGEAAIAAFGLSGVYQRMGDYTKGSIELLAKMIPRVRGLSAALAATSDSGKEYANTLAQIQDAQDSYQKATQIATQNAGRAIEKVSQQIQNVFIKDIGLGLVESVAKVLGSIDGLETKIKNLVKAIAAIATAAAVTGLLVVAWMNPIAAAVIAGTVAVAGLYAAFANGDEALRRRLRKTADENIEKFTRSIVEASTKVVAANNEAQRATLETVTETTKALTKTADELDASLKATAKNLKAAFSDMSSALDADVKKITNAIGEAEKRSESLQKSTASTVKGLEQELFDESLSRQNANQQVRTVAAELKRVNVLRKQAVLGGQTELAQELIKQQTDLAKQLVKLDSSRLASLEKINEARKKLEDDFRQKQRETSDPKALAKSREAYVKEVQRLGEERAKVEDATTGKFASNYRAIYTKLIEEAKKQQNSLLEVEKRNIEILKSVEIAAALEVAAVKAKIKAVQDFDIGSLEGKTDEQVTALLKQRQDDLSQLALVANNISDEASRKLALQQINQLKTLEQKKIDNQLEQQELKNLQEQLKLNTEILNKRTEAVALQAVADKKALEDVRVAAKDATKLTLFDGIPQEASSELRAHISQLSKVGTLANSGQSEFLQTSYKIVEALKLFERNRIKYGTEIGDSPYVQSIQKLVALQQALLKQPEGIIERAKEVRALQEASASIAYQEEQNALQTNEILAKRESILKRLNAIRAENAPVLNRNRGGIAYGQDSVPARLTPGEYVMNASTTRRFYSQLVGMNSRNNALNLNSGGSVTTGDINISMTSSGSEGYDVQRLGRQLRREIRRGTLSL